MAQDNLLIRLENTDAWFIRSDKPPQAWDEAVMNTDEVPWNDALAMIDAGAAKEQSRYSLDGTLVVVYAIAEQPDAKAAA
jgi:hypothetical protein